MFYIQHKYNKKKTTTTFCSDSTLTSHASVDGDPSIDIISSVAFGDDELTLLSSTMDNPNFKSTILFRENLLATGSSPRAKLTPLARLGASVFSSPEAILIFLASCCCTFPVLSSVGKEC